MTDMIRQQYEDAFHLYAGAKGSMNTSETTDAIRALGFNVTDAEMAEKAGGSTDLSKFLSLAQTYAARGSEDDSGLYEAFRTFDKLGNGSVPAKEFAQYATILGDKFSQAEVDALMEHASSGSINYEDLIKKLQTAA
eukprot:TRINITY_DN12519_c0_g1_i1.p2 TRINITY_DN12519_c0_g1~~TRINITY_DN12519_c0_g1_i1.p2  ORF type:complete len:137 (+),score=46.13 TRINITY_DN12519_c0_g1_i1:113-523(+)